MTTERKRRLYGAALVVLGLWPAVQIGLVVRYDVSSWKLGAWGMYATPQRNPGLELRGFSAGEMIAPFGRPYPAWLRAELRHFQRYRRALGRLYPPERLGAVILARRSDLGAVRLDVAELHLDRRTAMLEKRQTRYSYTRDGS